MISEKIRKHIDKKRKIIYDIIVVINKITADNHKGGPW